MNTRTTKRTTTNVFGGPIDGNATTGASTFGNFGQKTSVFDAPSSLFGGSKQLAGTQMFAGGQPSSPSGTSVFNSGIESSSEAQRASLFGTPSASSLQGMQKTTSMFGAQPGASPFGGATEPPKSPSLAGTHPGASSVFGGHIKIPTQHPPHPEPPKSPTLFGTTTSVPVPAPAPAPAPEVGMFGQPVAPPPVAQPPVVPSAQPLFGGSAAVNPDTVSALLESVNALTKKLEASEKVVIKYQVVCGVHCHPLTEMSKDELGGPYVNGFTCSRCLQVQRDFSDRYYHCTVCPTDPQKGGVDFCCHCIRSYLGSEVAR